MLNSEFSIETLAVVVTGITWVEMLIISLSYFVAFMVKKTFGIGSILFYFSISTLVYFLLFVRLAYNLVEGKSFFDDCATFFIFIGITRFISGLVLLLSIWKQHKES